MNLTNNKFSYC